MTKRTYMRRVDDDIQLRMMIFYGEKFWPEQKPEELGQRDWDILTAHVRDRQTYDDIAQDYGFSRARAHQLAYRAMCKVTNTPYFKIK
jgi:hypothetical protein